MTEKLVPINRRTLGYLARAIVNFLKSPVGGKAAWLIFCLFALMLGINGMNVANSFVGRYFMSSIEAKDAAGFARYTGLYLAVFAGATLSGSLFRFTEERLALLWREWLTRRITGIYLQRRLYLHMTGESAVSNPDQRMSEDVKQLTTTTLSFILMLLNGTMTVLSFSGVLWAISPTLFGVAVLYAIMGSTLAIFLGRPLVRLNYCQSDYEANFRSELIQVREAGPKFTEPNDVESARGRINLCIDGLVSNIRRIIAVNRNLSFFTSGYNYLIQLIPVILVAPQFMNGHVDFGVIGQATMAFATLLGAFSLVITQFQAISSYASVIARLGEFVEHAESCEAGHGTIQTDE